MKTYHRAETILSTLVAISLLVVLTLIYQKWRQTQIQHQSYLYQEQQALQIIENQIACHMAAVSCESTITQNQLTFKVDQTGGKITVRFPLGKVEVAIAKN